MAKEPVKYQLTTTVLTQGYYAKIDGREFDVSMGEVVIQNVQGKKQKTLKPGSVVENQKETGKDYFEDLTPQQKHELVQAGVILLKGKQADEYKKWLAEVFYAKKEE